MGDTVTEGAVVKNPDLKVTVQTPQEIEVVLIGPYDTWSISLLLVPNLAAHEFSKLPKSTNGIDNNGLKFELNP